MQDEKQDGKNNFTYRIFQKYNFSSNNRGKSTGGKYDKRWDKEKKCWICHKPDSWSTNYLAFEIEESKKRFGNKQLEYKKKSDYERQLR